MQRKLLVASLLLNVVLAVTIVVGAWIIGAFAESFTRIPAERWRTQFDLLTDTRGGVVFVGDSITEGGHWFELFGSASVRNRGSGGDTTQELLARIEQFCTLRPAKIFLMIGVNDLNSGVARETTLANCRALFDGFAARLPCTGIYVQSVLPVNDSWIGSISSRTRACGRALTG